MERTRTFDLAAADHAGPLKLLQAFKLARTLGWLSLCATLGWQQEWVLAIGCGVAAIVGLLPWHFARSVAARGLQDTDPRHSGTPRRGSRDSPDEPTSWTTRPRQKS